MTDKANRIGFKTSADLTAADVSLLATSISGIYDAMLIRRVRTRLDDEALATVERMLQYYEKADGPYWQELFMMYRDMLRHWRMVGPSPRFPVPPPFLPFPQLISSEISLPDIEIYREIDRYASEDERLRVHRIRISSPGGFSFEGLGDIVREFRELVKDIWYRNRQEKHLGDLEIIERSLRIRDQHPEIDLRRLAGRRPDREVIDAVATHTGNLRRLEDRGKIESVPENLDYTPD